MINDELKGLHVALYDHKPKLTGFKNFYKICEGFDIKQLNEMLHESPFWNEIEVRQNYPGSAHKDTETIYLRWAATPSLEAAFTEIPAVNYPAWEKLWPAALLTVEALAQAGGKALGRVIIVRLKPGGKIDPHFDGGQYADHYERFHLCLESEEGNRFFSETEPGCGEFVHMKPGELWVFNHKATHWVENNSENYRTHLIIDAVAPRWRRERVNTLNDAQPQLL